MDKMTLDLQTKRIHSVGISQAINVKRLIEDYLDENFKGKDIEVCKLYLGHDNDYFRSLGFDIKFSDIFRSEMTSPIDLCYRFIAENLPYCDILFVLIDGTIDRDATDELLANIPLTSHIVYLYDNLLTDYSNGEFYKRFVKCDTDIQTYNRKTDVNPAINMLLNKLKKYQVKYLTSPEFASSEFIITQEILKDDELLDYDKIVLVNGENLAEYNIRIREALSRTFSPTKRDKMINYSPITAKVPINEYETKVYYIPIYSDLTVVDKITEPEPLVAPIYRFKYVTPDNEEIEFEIPVNLDFINNLNEGAVDKDCELLPPVGYKLYFSYAVPLYAMCKRYDKILLIISDDSILNKSVVYTAIRYAKNSFKIVHGSNIVLE